MNIGCADYNGDFKDDIFVSFFDKNNSYIKIFDNDGNYLSQMTIKNQTNIFNVAGFTSLIDGNDAKILISPKYSGDSQVRIFDKNQNEINKFFVFNNKLKGGMSFAVGE